MAIPILTGLGAGLFLHYLCWQLRQSSLSAAQVRLLRPMILTLGGMVAMLGSVALWR